MRKLLIILIALWVLTGCATSDSYVARDQAVKTVFYGKVLKIDPVTIGGTNTGIGSTVGSAASIFGSSNNHSWGTYLVRGLAGAIAGAVTEDAITQKKGNAYTILRADGSESIISTPATSDITIGNCVRVTIGGTFPLVTGAEPGSCE